MVAPPKGSGATSMLSLYKRDVFPTVTAAGFVGTVAKTSRKYARGSMSVHASGRDAELRVRITGWFDDTVDEPLNVTLDVPAAKRQAAIASLEQQMRKMLERLAARDAAEPVRAVATLGEALDPTKRLEPPAWGRGSVRIGRMDLRP